MRRYTSSLFTFILALAGCSPEGPSAYVDANIKPDTECVVSPGSTESVVRIPSGVYDVAASGEGSGRGFCERPYQLALRVNSQLRANFDMELGRAEPNVIQINEAVITLRDRQGARMDFGGALPNPFRVNTNTAVRPSDSEDPSLGVVFVEGIPTPYAEFLTDYVDDQILLEIQLVGTTLGDVEVDIAPFTYPVRICFRCLVFCGGNPSHPFIEMLEEDLMEECNDNAGADGRVCLDPSCELPLN